MINITLGLGLPALLYCVSQFLTDLRVDDYLKVSRKESERYNANSVSQVNTLYPRCSISFPISLYLLTCLLLVVISTYLVAIAPIANICRNVFHAVVGKKQPEPGPCIPGRVTLTHFGSVIQLFVFFSVYVIFIAKNESHSS